MHTIKLRSITRRQLLVGAATTTLIARSSIARSQDQNGGAAVNGAAALDYPTRPVHVLVGFSPGGPTDLVARLIGQWLSERLGQPFVIENRTGAGGNVATELVVRAQADGYTLLAFGAEETVNATLYDNLNFNFIRDIAPVAGIIRTPDAMLVNPSVPAKTVPEFIAYAKTNPAKINMATPGNGTPPHIFGELFKMMTGVDLVSVAYRGTGPALVDLLSGQMQVMFSAITASIEHIRTGKLRALAVTSASRSALLPDVPTVGEFVPGYEGSAWFGLGAPKRAPSEIVHKLNTEINAGLADPKLEERLANLGGTPMPMTPANFGKLIADETGKWSRVVKFAGIKLD
jgi:tripartite-type tricarboxylate transporter receptor subunit TctC